MTDSSDNLFEGIPELTDEEFAEELARGDGVRVERIVSRGHRSPEGFWYDQDEDEWVVLLRGSAELEFADGRRLEMRPGHHVWIPAHERHRVARTDGDGDTVWVCVYARPGRP
ncbi:MAG TPA: cupin domain-containing protein [bacterium]|nr:cupin domain-containing protein [bacterium]